MAEGLFNAVAPSDWRAGSAGTDPGERVREDPVIPGVRSLHWPLPNPAGRPIEAFRDVRDELSRHIAALVRDLTGENA